MGVKVLHGDCREVLKTLHDESVHCVVTSPPFFNLRDYGVEGQIGLENTLTEYIETMVGVFREIKRVLRKDGTVWLNLGDCYAGAGDRSNGGKGYEHGQGKRNKTPDVEIGLKPKDLIGVPHKVAFALQADGWWLRSDIVWEKPNAMPDSVQDRPTRSHEYIFFLTKSDTYYYDIEATREPHTTKNLAYEMTKASKWGKKKEFTNKPNIADYQDPNNMHSYNPNGRNRRTVWRVNTTPYSGSHFAVYPEQLIEPCILGGSPTKVCTNCGGGWWRIVGNITNWVAGCKCVIEGEPYPTKQAVVLDPFFGSGTTGKVAMKHGRDAIGIELNPEYTALIEKRLAKTQRVFDMTS